MILYAENFAVNLNIGHHTMMWRWEETGSYQSSELIVKINSKKWA